MDVQIPPEGVPALLDFGIPAPEGMGTLGGVRLYFTFSQGRPSGLFPVGLELDGSPCVLMEAGVGPGSLTFVSQLPQGVPVPAQARVTVNEGGHLEPGTMVNVYAWGAQTASGSGALNPDEGGESSILTGTIEVGRIEVLSWQEWNRVTGANQGEGSGS